MSDQPIEPTPEPVNDTVELPQTIEQAKKLRAENKSLRTRVHALEEKYGEAAAVVSAMQLAEVKRLAGGLLHDPDDLIAHQPDMTAYFDAEFTGMVSADRVTEQAKALIAQRPHLGKPQSSGKPPSDRPIEGLRPGAAPADKPKPTSWATAIRGS